MSSRNVRLTEVRERISHHLSNTFASQGIFKNHSIEETKKFVEEKFKETSFELEYFEIADEKNLLPVQRKVGRSKTETFIAVFADEVRLIDNLDLN